MDKNSKNLELDKILSEVSAFAVTEGGKNKVTSLIPATDLLLVRQSLEETSECDRLLFTHGIGRVQYFEDVSDILIRAKKGSCLSCAELLSVKGLLVAARSAYEGVERVEDEDITLIREHLKRLYFDEGLEYDIEQKIISAESVADNASDRLYAIRVKMKSLNEKIREKLSECLFGGSKYLQDGIVTMRNDRYVVPVKAEYKSQIKGFVHDRSKTGATLFIEPEYVLELNNELIALSIDEKEEIEVILRALSSRIGAISDRLMISSEVLYGLDMRFARAEYSYAKKCVKPKVGSKGVIKIIKGRHPLIDKDKIVPVSISLGEDYDILLLSGANTGGKTVTMKMCGLFCLMAECGLYLPAAQAEVSVFNAVYSDIGDSQSIEESLSTFSSHITNVIEICDRAKKSLVLLDELGGGTNPDEGQALAKAVIKHLLGAGCKGIVTTHFAPLKEFAYECERLENASMEFDFETLQPLYSIKIGIAGASNALAVTKRLGMRADILSDAYSYLSEGAKTLENTIARAEADRVKADENLKKARLIQAEYEEKLKSLNQELEKAKAEREKNLRLAKQESKRIIAERTQSAEELLNEIEEIFNAEEITQSDLIRARTLKNKIKNIAFDDEDDKVVKSFLPPTRENLKVGCKAFVTAMGSVGEVLTVSFEKGEAEVLCGNIKIRSKIKDLSVAEESEIKPQIKPQKTNSVKVYKKIPFDAPILELNVIGESSEEALSDVENFLDKAVLDNLEEVKIIHGLGTGKLRKVIWEYLKKHIRVDSFRQGKYGEGEAGVTVVKLK